MGEWMSEWVSECDEERKRVSAISGNHSVSPHFSAAH